MQTKQDMSNWIMYVTGESVVESAIALFGVDPMSKTRSRRNVECRWAVIKVCRDHLLMSYPDMGRLLELDHTSVHYLDHRSGTPKEEAMRDHLVAKMLRVAQAKADLDG